VDVLEPAEVASYGDQVQVLLVLLRVRRHRPAVGAFDHERHRPVPAGRDLGLGEAKRVAVLRHHHAAGEVGGVLRAFHAVALLGAVAVGTRHRRRLDRPYLGSDPEGEGEDCGERNGEGGDPHGRALEEPHDTR